MSARPLLAALAALLLAAALGACGGGSGSTGSATVSTLAPAAASESPSAPPPRPHSPESAAKTRAERRIAARAAPFVIADADNSVPTFGSEAGAAERAGAEANLKAYLHARAAADWASACRLLAKGVREGYEKLATSSKVAKPSCAEILPALSKGADLSDPLAGHLLSLRVHGQNAFALFYGPGHQRYMVPMNREDGQWRPTQAAPIAYPPGTPGGN